MKEKTDAKNEVNSVVPVSSRIGIAKGKLRSPEGLDDGNKEIAGLFADQKKMPSAE